MKKLVFSLLCLGSAAVAYADTTTNIFADDNARASYALGMLTGQAWQEKNIPFDTDLYVRGLHDGRAGGATMMTKEEATAAFTKFRQDMGAQQQKMEAAKAVKNKADGDAFLAANKNNPGVVTLPDGLQYLVQTNGTGAMPTPSDTVTVNYSGTLLDGTEFDSSYKRGKPASFPVGGVIRGWTEALQKMNVGSKWKLFIPPGLAYGEQGRNGIPGNSTLIFEVELLDTKTPAAPPMAPPVAPLTSDIIKVPSKAEMDKGAKIEVIKADDAAKLQSATNSAK